MFQRTHYLICYDISNHRQRHRVCQMLQAYAVGQQQSAYLCWLTLSECQHLQAACIACLEESDALLWVHLSQRYQPQYMGTAQPWEAQTFMLM